MKGTNYGIEFVLITELTVLLIRNLSLNLKVKSKRIVVVISLATVVWFNNLESVSTISLPMPLTSVVRIQPSYQHDSKVQIAKVSPRKKDLFVYKSPKEILFLMYLTDPRLLSNQEVLKLVKELRVGSWGLVGTAALLAVIILILSLGEGFVANNPNPGWGLDKPNPFQPPTAEHRYPPYYNLFFPRKTCYLDRPGGSHIMSRVNPQSSREELTQLSTNLVPTQTQASGFVKDGDVDLHQVYDEVNRRASEIGCKNFDYTFKRFEALTTECGNVTVGTTREASTVLEGEMRGYYKNAPRVDYRNGIKDPDY